VYPDCENTSRTRGLCHGHYQTARAYVRAGKASEEDLSARGLLMPKGEGGSAVNDHGALLLTSNRRGRATPKGEGA